MTNETDSRLIQDVQELDPRPFSASPADGTDASDQKKRGDADGTDNGDADGTDAGDSDGTDNGDADGTDGDGDGTDNA